MIRHLTTADYTAMPWANDRGQTIEMLRVDRPEGGLLYRLSVAAVTGNGPFSLFQGIERILTVISGPGFDLVGDIELRADPLVPVAFPGYAHMAAAGVTGPSEDFNVMTCARLPKPEVQVISAGVARPIKGRALVLFALDPAKVGPHQMARRDLLITDEAFEISGGPVIAVTLTLF